MLLISLVKQFDINEKANRKSNTLSNKTINIDKKPKFVANQTIDTNKKQNIKANKKLNAIANKTINIDKD